MTNSKIKYKHIFLVAYALLLMSRIMVLTNNYSLPINPIVLEFGYLAICVLLYIMSRGGKVKVLPKNASVVILLLLFHTLLWGIVFVNASFPSLIHSMYRSQIIFVFIIATTVLMIYEFDIMDEFIKTSFIVLVLILSVQFIFHIAEVNFTNIINVMSKDKRTRANFGFGHYNTLGAVCSCVIIIGFIAKNIISKPILHYSRILATIMLLCAASRSAITGVLVYFIAYFSTNIDDYIISKRMVSLIKIARVVIVAVFSFWVFFEADLGSFLVEAQRSHLFFYTLPMFFRTNRVLIGLGYASNTHYGTGVTPYTTYWLDNAYIYYLVTTGILGLSVIIAASTLIFVYLYKARKRNFDKKVFSLYMFYLYGSLFEVILFSSGTIINYIYLPIFVATIANPRKLQNNNIANIKHTFGFS